MTDARSYLNEGLDHGIAPLHLSKETFQGMDPTGLLGKPFHAGKRSFLIAKVDVTDTAVVITLGREITSHDA
jgi:hypothetical protein